MHEASIVANVFLIVRGKMDKLYGRRYPVKNIRVVVGQMSTVVPEALDFAFELVGAGTEFQDVKREIEIVPLRIHCNDCGTDMVIDEPFLFCRSCDSFNIDIISGKELYVDSFEIDNEITVSHEADMEVKINGN